MKASLLRPYSLPFHLLLLIMLMGVLICGAPCFALDSSAKSTKFKLGHIGTLYPDKPVIKALWCNFSQLILLKEGGSVEIVDLLDRKKKQFEVSDIRDIAIDAGERYLALTKGRIIYIYDIQNATQVGKLEVSEPPTQMAFQNARTLVVSFKNQLTFFSFKGSIESILSFASNISSFQISRDGKKLAVVGGKEGQAVELFSLQQSKPSSVGKANMNRKIASAIFYSDDRNLLITYQSRPQIDVWQWPKLKRILTISAPVANLQMREFPEHKRLLGLLISPEKKGHLYLWTDALVYLGHLSGNNTSAVVFSRNESVLATLKRDRIEIMKIIWNQPTKKGMAQSR